MKIICDKLNIDVHNVIESAATKNFGFQKFIPGPGLVIVSQLIHIIYRGYLKKKATIHYY